MSPQYIEVSRNGLFKRFGLRDRGIFIKIIDIIKKLNLFKEYYQTINILKMPRTTSKPSKPAKAQKGEKKIEKSPGPSSPGKRAQTPRIDDTPPPPPTPPTSPLLKGIHVDSDRDDIVQPKKRGRKRIEDRTQLKTGRYVKCTSCSHCFYYDAATPRPDKELIKKTKQALREQGKL